MMKEIIMTVAAVSMFAGLSANQPAAPAQAQQQEKSATSLTADELAFAAKLNDQNRKAFSTQFSAKQRKDAMDAASCQAGAGSCATSQKAAIAPNDAVAKVLKEVAPTVAEKKAVVVEKKEAAASPAKSATKAK